MINLEAEIWKVLLNDIVFGPELQNLLEIGELIWQRGWAEANAGNVSLSISNETVQSLAKVTGNIDPSHQWFLVSAKGSRYREFKKLGFSNFVLAGCDPEENDIKSVFIPETRKPTSEWATHLSIQNWLQTHRAKDKIVLHAHPEDWIIISNLPEYKINKSLLAKEITECLPEIDFYFPGGLILLPYATPGSEGLAEITTAALKDSSVIIWEKHGIVVTAENVNLAFDYLEIMAKAAKVYLALRKK